MPYQKNDEFQLQIDGYTAEGSGVGHPDGFAVFVPGGAKGDTVLCHVIKAKKNYAVARIKELLTPSPHRIEPDCPVFARCGGCVYRHITYEEELRLKRQRVEDCFARLGHLQVAVQPVIGGARTRYRNKAQYPVSQDENGLQIGFYAERSHRVIDCKDCLLEPAEFAQINDIFRIFITKHHISIYDERTGKGLLRHIYLRKAFATGEIMVTAVINGDTLPHADALIDMLTKSIPAIRSIYSNTNPEKTNVVLGKTCRLLWGKETIEDELCGLRLQLHPLSFYQVNHDQTELLYRKAAQMLELTGEETLLDLYCGAGTIGLSMAQQVKRLIGVEVVPEAIASAKENARRNGIAHAEFLCADAETAAARLQQAGIKPDVVIVDPPRKGCGATLPQTIDRMRPKKLLYISCDPATLARDCAALADLGWQIQSAAPIDLFPATAHVETVVLLSKGEIDSKKVRVEFSLEDMDMSGFQKGATYEQIKAYVLEKHGLKVSSLYISQVKRKCGLDVGPNYNLSKKEDAKVPQCPPEKEAAIMEALRYFGMI